MRLNDDNKPFAPWMSSPPASARSSAAHSARNATTSAGQDPHPGSRREVVLVVPGIAQVRHRPPRRLRLGLERLMMYVTGMKNIRDVIPFPRTPGYAEF